MAKHLISSDRSIQAMKPAVKRLNDGEGLHVRQKDGSKHFYQDYTFNRKRTSLSLGRYPEIGLAEARRRSREIRSEVAHGVDPSEKRRVAAMQCRKIQKGSASSDHQVAPAGSFQYLATLWLEVRGRTWSKEYSRSEMGRLKTHVFPKIGHLLISDIPRQEFTKLLEAIDATGQSSTTGRVNAHCRRICDFAVAKGFLRENPCRDLHEALQTTVTKHHAAITSPDRLKEFLEAVEKYRGCFVVKCALQISMNTFLRSTALRGAQWSEIDLDRGVWLVCPERTKGTVEEKLNRESHLVPLSRQVIEILRQLHGVTGRGCYVFAGQGWINPIISENTINKAIRLMGYSTRKDQTLHGFRATARTMLVERLGWPSDIVELQLDHKVSGANGRAYNRTEMECDRHQMMQAWSDYLDSLRKGSVPQSRRHHGQRSNMSSSSNYEVSPLHKITYKFPVLNEAGWRIIDLNRRGNLADIS